MYIFNSRHDKLPFGAIKTNEVAYFTFKIKDQDRPDSVYLLLKRKDGGIKRFTLSYDGYDNGHLYSLSMSVSAFGTYFYRFAVVYGAYTVYVGRLENGDASEFSNREWQLTVYDRGFTTPRKFGSDIIYHIFVDRFNKVGEPAPIDYGTIHSSWNEDVDVKGPDGVYHANDFFGGNLKGIIEKLDYLKDLGVTIIYLSPIFKSVSNHRYDTADYMQIDPMIGTEDDFEELVGKARIRGMRIMLDGVFNHTGSDSIYFNQENRFPSFGAYQGSASPYRNWFMFNKDGSFRSWWGIKCVPTLNKESKSLRKYLFGENGAVAKWTKYDIDWRLDVVDELPDDYLCELRERIRQENAISTVIGEVWEDASCKYSYGELRPYFTKGELDGVMNYVFRNAILDYAKGGSAYEFTQKVIPIIENYPKQCLDCCMTLLGSHDTIRVLTDLAGINIESWSIERQRDYKLNPEQKRLAIDRLFVAAALAYTLPGIPSIFYGDEVGIEGGKDPICRRTYPWGKENNTILSYYKKLGVMRGRMAKALIGDSKLYTYNNILVMERGMGIDKCTVIANTSYPQGMPLDGVYINQINGERYDGSIFMPQNSVVVLTKE